MKRWITAECPQEGKEINASVGSFLGTLLRGRGLTTIEQANKFFGCSALSSPYDMKDMDKAVNIIREALDNGDKITIYGDYDCDGVTSAAMLYGYFEAMGAEADYYIPERSEGYGMNKAALEKIIASGTSLIITVDNGISAVNESNFIKESGVKLIITDHHEPPEILPVCDACINPKRPDDKSAFKELCGAGIALKLLCALEEDERVIMEQYAELAAVGTVGDVVPLVGENRYIVQTGLYNITDGQNIGLSQLLKSAGVKSRNITSEILAYAVCPRINAAGRMSTAKKAVELLLSESVEQASPIADELCLLNETRKKTENEILSDADRMLKENPVILNEPVIIVSGENWHFGVIGIAAARLLEKYGKPVVMIGIENGEGRGSVRGIDGFSVYDMLENCKDLLLKFGGHTKAGGFSISEEKIEEFKKRVRSFCRKSYKEMPEYTVNSDMEITLSELTEENISSLSKLEPFGAGNQKPLFLIKNCMVYGIKSLKEGKYTGLIVKDGSKSLKALCFGIPYNQFRASEGTMIDLMSNAEINEYNGSRSVVLKVKELRPSNFNEDRFFAAQRVYERISLNEPFDTRLLRRIIPTMENLRGIYDIIRANDGRISAEDICVYNSEINYCMLRITLDAFSQAGMAEFSPGAENIKLIPKKGKTDVFSIGILAKLKAMLEEEQTARTS